MAINPTPFVTGTILTASQMTNLPMGLAASTSATATTAFVANTSLTVLSVSATIYAGRTYQMFGKLNAQYAVSSTVGAAVFVTANSIDRTFYYQTEAVGAFFNLGVSGFYNFYCNRIRRDKR